MTTMKNKEQIDVGTLLANVLITSNQDNFDENMKKLLDETAEILGDVVGSACGNPELVLHRFGMVMFEAAQKRI